MVEFLLIQPGVDVGARDMYGETASDAAGQRCSKDKSAIAKEVRTMLEGNCSVEFVLTSY